MWSAVTGQNLAFIFEVQARKVGDELFLLLIFLKSKIHFKIIDLAATVRQIACQYSQIPHTWSSSFRLIPLLQTPCMPA